MPKAVDKHPQSRGTGNALFNPLRQGVSSYEDPLSAIGNDMKQIGDPIRDLFGKIGAIFGLPSPEEIVAGVANGVGQVIAGATELVGGLGSFFGRLIGGLLDPFQVPILDPSKVLNLPGLLDNVGDAFRGLFNIWFNRNDGDGTAAQFNYTIEAIKDAVINGYTVHTCTSDEVGWAVPDHTEMIAILIGGGEQGHAGSGNNGGDGGDGGLHGSCISMPIDLTGITALDIRVGSANNKSYIREAATTPHTGAVIIASPDAGAAGGVVGTLGLLTTTTSLPGSGGKGGKSGSAYTSGTDGSPSGLAAGGNGGARGTFGQPGGAGASVPAGSAIKSGGGGGGGGGGANVSLNKGGAGGAGGYPGGAGGGSGAANGIATNPGGPGAPGLVWLAYK